MLHIYRIAVAGKGAGVIIATAPQTAKLIVPVRGSVIRISDPDPKIDLFWTRDTSIIECEELGTASPGQTEGCILGCLKH